MSMNSPMLYMSSMIGWEEKMHKNKVAGKIFYVVMYRLFMLLGIREFVILISQWMVKLFALIP